MNCLHCNRPMTQWLKIQWQQTGDPPHTQLKELSREEVGFGYEGNGFFCSMHCGWEWAVKTAKGTQQWVETTEQVDEH